MLRSTADRLLDELTARSEFEPRGLLGFVEAARKEAKERWYSTQLPPRRTTGIHGPGAHLHPLLELLDDGAPLGIALASSERIRLLQWQLGRVSELHDWEAELADEDWRERKAERPDPARGTATSASGRDQYDQRLEANRERFATQTGSSLAVEAKRHRWRLLLLFGDERYAGKLEEGFGGACPVRHVDQSDLVSEPVAAIEQRAEGLVTELNRERELGLIERIREAAYAEGRSALGPQETAQTLVEGRVEHLVYDADRDYSEVDLDLDGLDRPPNLPLADWLIELALSTGAEVTPVEGEAAGGLADQDGVAALLRY